MPTETVLDEIVGLLEASYEQLKMTPDRVQDLHAKVTALPSDQQSEALVAGQIEITRTINEPWMRALDLMNQVDAAEIERDGRIPEQMRICWSIPAETLIWSSPPGNKGTRQFPVPDAFSDGQGLMSSSLALQGVMASLRSAQAGGKGWREGDGQMPDFEFARRQGIALVMMRPWDDTPPGQAVAAQLWEHVAKLSDLDGDVFLAMMAQALSPAEKHPDGSTWISAAAILNYRGIQPKRYAGEPGNWQHGHRTEDIQEISACVSRLRRMRVELRGIETREATRGKRKPKVIRTTHEGYLVTIDEVIMQGELGGTRHAIGWRFRLGRCITEFLSDPNRMVATVMKRVLEYDHYRERVEKRLGLYFTIHRRIAASYRAPLRRAVHGLFDELVLDLDERNPTRTRDRFEKAMNRLVKDGIIPGWTYTGESRAKISALKARGWLHDWLSCVIEIPAPGDALTEAAV